MNYEHKVLGRAYPNLVQTILHMYNWYDEWVSYCPFTDINTEDDLVAIFRCKLKKPTSPEVAPKKIKNNEQ